MTYSKQQTKNCFRN